MEEEIRYYYNLDKYEILLNKLKEIKELKYKGCFLELTIQYDHPIKEYSFYDKKIDGRFRLRSSKNIKTNQEENKISWKRRLPDTQKGLINNEEEIEVDLKQIDNMKYLLENVLKLKRVESYQRYRNIFYNKDIEIAVDKYPFGVALEIENKGKNPEGNIKYWADKIGVDINKAYRLSWDDKYTSLCKDQNIKPVKDVIFDKNLKMPEVKEQRDLYDENRNLTNETIYKDDPIPKGRYYITVVIFIQNNKNEFLIQKRTKDQKWATTGGHPISGETSKQGIITEVKEELGIDIKNPKLIKTIKTEDDFVDIYYLKQNIDIRNIKMQKEEVQDVKWSSIKDIKEMIDKDDFLKSHAEFLKEVLNKL